MLMAVIGEINGNLPALESALQFVDSKGIQRIVCTGNLVAGGPFPSEVIQQLELYRVTACQGAADRLTLSVLRKTEMLQTKLPPEEYEMLCWTRGQLKSREIEYLRGLKKRIVTAAEGMSVCLTHGAPSNPQQPLDFKDESALARQREFMNVHIIAFGAPPRPWWKLVSDTLFVNPGTLGGKPREANTGTVAIVNTESKPWGVEFEEVHFNRKRNIDQFRKLSAR
jgi:predicted phosphodiesterase